MARPLPASAYRYPGEHIVLLLTLGLVLLVIAFTATATLCGSAVFVVLVVGLAYLSSRSHHEMLLNNAHPVTEEQLPELDELVHRCQARLQPGAIQTFVAHSKEVNAYTFGLSSPKVVVLYSALVKLMDDDELAFIIGHELGHVALGHTWLNSLVGGMAGVPSSSFASAMLTLVFLWWNRTCEYSADRAGLLACGKPEKAISALVKLAVDPTALKKTGMELALRQIDAQDESVLNNLGETFSTHPMIARRIEALRRFSTSDQYRRLQ